MTEWKMPEWMREVLNYNEEISQAGYEKDLLTSLRKAKLLSTPTERDANERRIEELEAKLDAAKHENTAAWIKTEKLEAENSDLININRSVAVCAEHTGDIILSDGLENGCLCCEIQKLEAEVERLKGING